MNISVSQLVRGLMLTGLMAACPAMAHAEVIANWRFEPGDFTGDASGNGNVLTNGGAVSNSVDFAPSGSSGSAQFDGADIMNTAGTLDLTSYDHLSISWWQKVETTAAAVVWEHSPNYNDNLGAIVNVVNDIGDQYVALRGTGVDLDTFAKTNDTWQQFTAQVNIGLTSNSDTVRSHEAVKVYRNGALVSTDVLGSVPPASFVSNSFFLGARSGVAAPFTGLLDEVKIETVNPYVNNLSSNPNLVGYWRLGEPNGATAWEIKGIAGNGAYVNATAGDYSQPGAIQGDLDTAMQFNGVDSYVDAGNDASLNGAWDGLTIAAWIKPDAGGLSGLKMIAGKWANDVANDQLGLFLNNGQLLVAVGDGTNGETGLTGNAILQADQWYFVAGTWDDSTGAYQLFVNGVLDNSGLQSGSGINTSSTTSLKIGAQVIGSGRYFSGVIDEVALFDLALSESQLRDFYLVAIPEPSSSVLLLVGAWGLLARRRKRPM